MRPQQLRIEDYDYDLRDEFIAKSPLSQRSDSRLLVYNNSIEDQQFKNLQHFLPQNATLVLNNTRVIPARLLFQKSTGGVVEIFCLEPEGLSLEQALQQQGKVVWKCLIGGASKWKRGQTLQKELSSDVVTASFAGTVTDGFLVQFSWTGGSTFSKILEEAGAVPLPPYLHRDVEEWDKERYQTVFAEREGSVAAPTASLHFNDHLLNELTKKGHQLAYLTLHVGAGTFKPVKAETMEGHHMHSEPFSVSISFLRQLKTASFIVAVGTTSLRSLESIYWIAVKLKHGIEDPFTITQWEVYDYLKNYHDSFEDALEVLIQYLQEQQLEELNCRTSLLIAPGYQFQTAKALVTNFHQPKSTLLLLVAAFVGSGWKKIYDHAREKNYRFLSYGDSSLLFRSSQR